MTIKELTIFQDHNTEHSMPFYYQIIRASLTFCSITKSLCREMNVQKTEVIGIS